MNADGENKGNIFKVPDGYFESFPERLEVKIALEEKKKPSIIPLHRQGLRWAAAAGIVLVIGISLFIALERHGKSVEKMLADVSSAELIAYLEETDMSTEEVLEMIDYGVIVPYNTDEMDREEILPDDLDQNTIDNLILEYEPEQP